MEKRRVQITGGSTYVISLPKRWAEEVDLKRGDYVLLIPQPDLSMLLVPDKASAKEANREIELPPVRDPEACVKNVIAAYLMGYDVIHVRLPRLPDEGYTDTIKEVIRHKLVGAEIMGETDNEILIRYLLRYTDLPLKDAINRIYILTRCMCADLARALKERSPRLLRQICARDDDVDRLYFLVLRQLREAVRDRKILQDLGLSTARECLDYQLVARCLERMADHASRAACVLREALGEVSAEVLGLLKDLCEECMVMLDKVMKALYKLEVKLANDVIAEAKRAAEIELKTTHALMRSTSLPPATILCIRTSLESLRRLCEYATDIAEIVIDLAVGRESLTENANPTPKHVPTT